MYNPGINYFEKAVLGGLPNSLGMSLIKLDNDDIAFSGSDSKIRIYSNYTPKYIINNNAIGNGKLVYLGNGKLVTNGNIQGCVYIWNASNGSSLINSFQAHNSSIFDILLADNSDIVSVSIDYTLKKWYSTNLTLRNTIEIKSIFPITSIGLQFSSIVLLPDGCLASGMNTGLIMIWNIDNSTLKANLTSHTNKVSALVILQNGDMASGSDDFTIKIWNTNSYQLKMTLYGHTKKVNCLCDLLNGYFAMLFLRNSTAFFKCRP
jgi:WD40 repeat protein